MGTTKTRTMVYETAETFSQQPYGEAVPYGDPNWYQGWASPYYKPTHHKFRVQVRKFVEEELMPNCNEWDEAKKMDPEIFSKAFKAGWLPCVVGAPWPREFTGDLEPPEHYDYFHELIAIDEVARCGAGGVLWGLFEGLQIGLPPVLNHGTQAQKDLCCADCLQGKAVPCLAITEPGAGSDVAAIKTTAEKSACGEFYVVNGEKKWITNGIFADYFTTAVRTGGSGMGGISLLLLQKGMEGLECRQMQCMGVWSSGTTFVTFDDVKVPVSALIGQENAGFKCIVNNFNHERFGFIAQATRFARVCLEEAFRYAFKRKTFGKRLVDHPVIRWKLAEMARQVESTHAMLEAITFQLCVLSKEEANQALSGTCALIKVQATKTFEYCAREAAQVFGGASYVRGGQGEKVERLYRDVRAYAIPGGSEEIMLDFAIRQAMKAKA